MQKNKLICALDHTDITHIEGLVQKTKHHVGMFKLGLEFFIAHGALGVQRIMNQDVDIFLDLKLHDIPNTVASAIKPISNLGVKMTTIHISGGGQMIEAAIDAAEGKLMLLGVTMLTSLSDQDIDEIGFRRNAENQVLHMAEMAANHNLDGIVCSPNEVAIIRKYFGSKLKLIVPGIRLKNDAEDDQKRTTTPNEAIANGADYIVVGRPITRADDPEFAAKMIVEMM